MSPRPQRRETQKYLSYWDFITGQDSDSTISSIETNSSVDQAGEPIKLQEPIVHSQEVPYSFPSFFMMAVPYTLVLKS